MAKKFLFNKKKEELKERLLVKTLMGETLEMCHLTKEIQAIKKLIKVHDILELNDSIHEKFTRLDGPVWDLASISDLDIIGRELYLYHHKDFNPFSRFKKYRFDLGRLVNIAKNNIDGLIN